MQSQSRVLGEVVRPSMYEFGGTQFNPCQKDRQSSNSEEGESPLGRVAAARALDTSALPPEGRSSGEAGAGSSTPSRKPVSRRSL